MRIARCVKEPAKIRIHLKPPGPKDSSAEGQISAGGKVLRLRPQPLDTCDVAVQLTLSLMEVNEIVVTRD